MTTTVDEHIWIEMTTLDDLVLSERVWMCNAHPGEEVRQDRSLPPPPVDEPLIWA